MRHVAPRSHRLTPEGLILPLGDHTGTLIMPSLRESKELKNNTV
jgi:hypothetical protein